MTMTSDWDEIVLTEEYQTDYTLLKRMIVNGIGTLQTVTTEDVFVSVLAHLLALLRYHIRHLPEVKDLDLTPYLPYIQAEIGIEIPLTESIPLIEFLRENKTWYGNKGNETLYDFIAQVINSPIEIRYPRDHIWIWSDPRCNWSGALSDSGPLPWSESKIAYWRDGIFWAFYTYVVAVLQAQDILNYQDFLALIKSIHPAGTQRFIELEYKYKTDPTPATVMKSMDEVQEFSRQGNPWPTWSNGWIWSDPKVMWSQHGGHYEFSHTYVEEIET